MVSVNRNTGGPGPVNTLKRRRLRSRAAAGNWPVGPASHSSSQCPARLGPGHRPRPHRGGRGPGVRAGGRSYAPPGSTQASGPGHRRRGGGDVRKGTPFHMMSPKLYPASPGVTRVTRTRLQVRLRHRPCQESGAAADGAVLRFCEPPTRTGLDSNAAVTLRLIFGTPVGSSSSSLMARRPIRLLSPCHPSRRITPPCGGSEPASDPHRGGHPGPGPGPSLHVNAFAARSRPRAGSAFAARPHFGGPALRRRQPVSPAFRSDSMG